MSGKPIKRQRLAQLDELGEEEVFRLYLQHGSVRALTAAIFEPSPGYEEATQYGLDEMYSWLHDEEAPGRWERWQKVRQLRGHVEADLVLEEAMKAEPKNASAQRVKVDALKWRAGVLNRDTYGAQQAQINVGVQFGSGWLEALRGMKEEEPEQVEEGEFEVVEGSEEES